MISCLVLSSFIYINHVYSFHFVPIKHKVSSCSTSTTSSSSSSTSSLFIKNTDVICIGEVLYDCIATGMSMGMLLLVCMCINDDALGMMLPFILVFAWSS